MLTNTRARLRKRLPDGVYTYVNNYVMKVEAIQESGMRGKIVICDEAPQKVGNIVAPYSTDKEDMFFNTEEQAILAYRKDKVKHAIIAIERAERDIIKHKAIIEMYPEYAI